MKFKVGDHVRVVAWCVPGVTTGLIRVCNMTGKVVMERVHDPKAGSDGVYKVQFSGSGHGSGYWFRACDLVSIDSDCTCVNTAKKEPIGECLVHDRPDPDPSAEAAARLVALVKEMEHG